MKQLREQLNQTTGNPNKVLYCGKLRIDRDSISGYLKTGRVAQREAFFDACADRQNFGDVETMQTRFEEWRAASTN